MKVTQNSNAVNSISAHAITRTFRMINNIEVVFVLTLGYGYIFFTDVLHLVLDLELPLHW